MSWKPGPRRVRLGPVNPTESVLGTATFAPGEMLSLCIDTFSEQRPEWISHNRVDHLLIHEPEPATLWDSLIGGSPLSVFSQEIRFSAGLAALGVHIAPGDRNFNEITVEAVGCGSWFGIHGFQVEPQPGEDFAYRIEYNAVKTAFWAIGDELSVGYGVNANLTRNRHPSESLQIVEQPVIHVKSRESIPFDQLMRIAGKALAFIEFATDEGVPIGRVFGTRSDFPDSQIELVAAWKQPESRSSGVHWLIPYPTVADNFGKHLEKWFELYEKLPLALDLYRTCRRTSGLQVEFRLFSIIAALESFHRSVYGEGEVTRCETCRRKNGLSLEQRLRDLIDRHGDQIGDLLTPQDCPKVSATRNYLAHQTPELLARSFPSNEWFFWYRRLSTVFELCMLAQLPFSHPDAFKNLVAQRWASIRSGFLGEWNLPQSNQ